MIGRVPFGYVVKDNEIEIIQEESDIIQQIFRFYHENQTGFSDISYFLNSQGLLKRGKSWHRYSVKRIIENKTYYGVVKMKDEEFEGNFPPIIKNKYIEPGKTGHTKKEEVKDE